MFHTLSDYMFKLGLTQHKNDTFRDRGTKLHIHTHVQVRIYAAQKKTISWAIGEVSHASTLRFKGIKRGRPLSTIAHPTRVKEGKSSFNSCVQSAHCVISCLCRTNGPCLLRVRMTKASPPSPWTLWLNEITHMS